MYGNNHIRTVKGQDFNLGDVPFITITPTHRQTRKLEYKQGEPARITGSSQEIETQVSKFDFDKLIDEIIQNGAIADQDLLKLAVSYRFAHFVSDAEDGNEKAAEEETGKQTEIIKTIVKTYNKLRCELKMDYVQSEKETGIISLTMVNISRMGCKKEYINRI